MVKRIIAPIALVLSVALAGCETPPIAGLPDPDRLREQADQLERQADAIDAQATAVARATRDAQDLAAQSTYAALSARATTQALDAIATQQVQSAQATAAAGEAHATGTAVAARATATTEAAHATATTEAAHATATVQSAQAAAEAVSLQATVQSIERRDARERMTQPLRAFGPWAVLVVGTLSLSWVILQLLPILKARLGAIPRDARGDLPLVALSQGGVMVLFDPTRGWGPATRFDDGDVSQPLLAEPEYQDGTTRRSQFVDWQKGGRPQQILLPPPSRGRAGGDGEDRWRVVDDDRRPALPANVSLTELLPPGQESIHHLALGLGLGDGGAEPIRADMARLVHVAVGGSSGWGKSVFLRMLAYQLARSSEPVDLALVDLEGVTFAPFACCGRLLWPVAEDETSALGIFQALLREMDRRRDLYNQYPGVDSLAAYNARADRPLPPVVCLVDEATALLASAEIETAIRTLVLRARKFGLWMVLGGQSWKASVLDTTIRDQLASRIQFKAMSASQSRVLLERGGAEDLDVAGRALAILPGREMIELQTPYVSPRVIVQALGDGGPRGELPAPDRARVEDGRIAQVRELAAMGWSKRKIARKVYGYTGGAAYQAVEDALRATTTTEDVPGGGSTGGAE